MLQKTQIFSEKFTSFIMNEDKGLLFSDLQQSILRNQCYIWGINHRFDNVNAQSTVMTFRFPDNKIALTCTGDAEDITFERIFIESDLQDVEDYFNGYEHILVMPHHGSKNNISHKMLEFFSPTMFIFSSGNGSQYRHPSLETYEKLSSITPSQHSWKALDYQQSIIAFDEEKKAHLRTSINKRKPIVFSTNFTGTIKFTNNSFFSLFTNIIEINKRNYVIDLSKRVEVDNPITLVIGEEKYENYYTDLTHNYYYGVKSSDNLTFLYYAVKELEEEG